MALMLGSAFPLPFGTGLVLLCVCVRAFRGVGVVRCRVGSEYNVCYHGASMSFSLVLI